MFKRIIVIVLDGCGVGETPDAGRFGDGGANTLGNLSKTFGVLDLPNLQSLGIGKIADINFGSEKRMIGSFGKMAEVNPAKNSDAGHWELMGLVMDEPFPVYPMGFPDEMVRAFTKVTGYEVIGNIASSGTEIIDRLGREHLDTKKLILYTSADSVFQLAAHADIMSPDELYKVCESARKILIGDMSVARVIARPFSGLPGSFQRLNELRRDFQSPPPRHTVLDKIKKAGLEVVAFGEIDSLFCGRDITRPVRTMSNKGGMDFVMGELEADYKGLLFGNLFDFDMLYGHRRDPQGYYDALKEFDKGLSRILKGLKDTDLLIITADHGNDPTFKGTDHTREYVPLLAYSNARMSNDLGTRTTFSDVGKTIADNFGLKLEAGTSFLKDLGV